MEIEQNNPQHQGQPSKVNQASYRGRANAIVENRPAFPSDSKFQRSPKRFVDLEEEDKTNIAALQQELQPYELKAKLPLALFKRCRQLMVCESCHRYGHVGRGRRFLRCDWGGVGVRGLRWVSKTVRNKLSCKK